MWDVFISYRRRGGKDFARDLQMRFESRGVKSFLDVEDLLPGKMEDNLPKSVQKSKIFVLILSPGVLDRCVGDDHLQDWVHREIVWALRSQKPIIPVYHPEFV